MPPRNWKWRVWHHRRLPLAVQSAAPIAAGDGPEIQSRRRFARGVRKALVPAAENGLRGWDTEPKPIETLASGTCRPVWPITMSGPSRILVSDHERLLVQSLCEGMKMTKGVYETLVLRNVPMAVVHTGYFSGHGNFCYFPSLFSPCFPRLSGMVIPRSSMLIVPLPQRLKVSAHVVDLKVWPVSLDSLVGQLWKLPKGEDAHIAMAHEVLS